MYKMSISKNDCCRCCSKFWSWCCGTKEYSSRTVWIGREHFHKYPPNVIRNQKYNTFTFIPVVSLYIIPIGFFCNFSKDSVPRFRLQIVFILFLKFKRKNYSFSFCLGFIQSVQILPELFLSSDGNISICTSKYTFLVFL